MAPLPLPEHLELSTVLTDLFNREVETHRCGPVNLNRETGAVITLIDAHQRVRYIWAFDLKLANVVGTALMLAHPDTAHEAIESGGIPADLRENVVEVVNVARTIINGEGRKHVQLGPSTFLGRDDFQDGFWGEIGQLSDLDSNPRYDFRMQVGGYGEGRMSLISVGDTNTCDEEEPVAA